MKHKEKQLEFVFLDKNLNLDGPDGFQKYCQAKNFPEENYTTRHSGGGSLMIWEGPSHLQENFNYNLSVVEKKQQIMRRY